MAVTRVGSEFGVELAADKPRMHIARQFDHLAQLLAWRTRRNDQAGRFQLRHVMVVDLVAVAMALGDLARRRFRPRQRAGLDRAGLAPRRMVPPRSEFSLRVSVLPWRPAIR